MNESADSQQQVTPRVSLELAGQVFTDFIRVEISRALNQTSGSFRLDLHDGQRAKALTSSAQAKAVYDLGVGHPVTLKIDKEPVLIGFVDALSTRASAASFEVSIVGRDAVGDLIDCAAAPNGPYEYLGLTALDIARQVAAPFKIEVSAIGDVGPAFERFAFEVESTAFEVIEKACHARALLALSDGVGGLVLTRGGSDSAPGILELGVNLIEVDATEDFSQRFSDYTAKGQAEKKNGKSLSASSKDPSVRRYRPKVIASRTEPTGPTIADQATWANRIAQGQSLKYSVTVQDWRGPKGGLWKPNQLATVRDRTLALDADLLIEQVAYRFDLNGTTTALTLVGPQAYDLLPEEEHRKKKKTKKPEGPLDGEAFPL